MDVALPLPRHCFYCGKGLTQRTRAKLTKEERLLVAIWNKGPMCSSCSPRIIEKMGRKK